MRFASSLFSSPALRMATRITCCVPSPLRTTSCARPAQTSRSALLNSSRASAPSVQHFLRPELSSITVSDVDSSESTLMQLKVSCTQSESAARSSSRGTSASVKMKPSMVAMFGSIMPAPFTMPTMRAPPLSVRLRDRSFGYRSVVMIDLAPCRAPSLLSAATAAGSAPTMSLTGRRQPITPVLLGSTSPLPAMPSAFAVASQMASLSASPSTPSPPGHTLLILLFTTIACTAFSSRRRRTTFTGAPGKRFAVVTAPNASVGSSSAMMVTFIVALIVGASTGQNWNPQVPIRNPSGKASMLERYAWCSSTLSKVSGLPAARWRRAPALRPRAGDNGANACAQHHSASRHATDRGPTILHGAEAGRAGPSRARRRAAGHLAARRHTGDAWRRGPGGAAVPTMLKNASYRYSSIININELTVKYILKG